jgi:hypothetical protein
VGTSDDSFRATDPGLFGFLAESDDNNVPRKDFGVVGYALNVGVLGFSGVGMFNCGYKTRSKLSLSHL